MQSLASGFLESFLRFLIHMYEETGLFNVVMDHDCLSDGHEENFCKHATLKARLVGGQVRGSHFGSGCRTRHTTDLSSTLHEDDKIVAETERQKIAYLFPAHQSGRYRTV